MITIDKWVKELHEVTDVSQYVSGEETPSKGINNELNDFR